MSVYQYQTKSGQRRWGYCLDLGKTWDAQEQRHRRQQLRREGFRRQKDAQAAEEAELPGVRLGSAPSLEDRRLTTGEWARRWLESRASIRPSTRLAYGIVIDSYIKPGIGQIPLTQLRADHLDAMLAMIRSGRLRPRTSRRRPDGQLSAQSIRQIFSVVQAMLNAAVSRRLIVYSPAVGVELEPAEHHQPSIWGPSEVSQFLAFAQEHEPRLALGYRLALSFGLRRGEVCGLRWSDVDTDEGLLTVRQQVVAVGGELVTGPPKTRRGERSLPLSIDPGFAAALREHRKARLRDRMAAPGWTETGLILAGGHGEVVPPWVLSNGFPVLARRAGLPVIRLHEARHTANSLWREAGIDTAVRQVWMGHSSPAMTDQTYMTVRRAAHDQAASLAAAYRVANGLPGRHPVRLS